MWDSSRAIATIHEKQRSPGENARPIDRAIGNTNSLNYNSIFGKDILLKKKAFLKTHLSANKSRAVVAL